ncbi:MULTISPECIES: PIN domain-containing protein [Streptomyces]|uniref:PIN domain-containing protein n=1 Tax=Streptomyces TaxID=1883 RepID=UPI0013A9C845|nr:PIN domain-containing protein [Streptomyces sennicomposti]MBY8866408.1 PIN domain-containing protein [Streptomyces sennicomposti]MYS45967.1 PIN domain-containing protein [Streptomyces sp. SID5998]
MTHIATLVLDSEGLSAWMAQDRKTAALFKALEISGGDLVVSANTIIEVSHGGTSMARLNWALSRTKIEPVTEQSAKAAAKLLKQAGLHGHKYAIDATVAETALRQPPPVAVLTSDADDLRKLCGPRVKVIRL